MQLKAKVTSLLEQNFGINKVNYQTCSLFSIAVAHFFMKMFSGVKLNMKTDDELIIYANKRSRVPIKATQQPNLKLNFGLYNSSANLLNRKNYFLTNQTMVLCTSHSHPSSEKEIRIENTTHYCEAMFE
jgi:hypothetical protein